MAPLEQQSPPLLTVAEKLVPSVLTSALLFVAVGLNAPPFADTSVVKLAFFALLPTLVSIALVQDELLLQPFKRAFVAVIRCSDPLSDDAEASAVAKSLAAARAELSRALLECWQTTRTGPATPVLSPALAALQHRQQQQQHHNNLHNHRRRRHAHKSVHSSSSELLTTSTTSSSHKAKSLYDQVKANLTDHAFAVTDTPIYCMDPTTGRFLHVNAQHKLVFTNVPDAACLFYVVRGKTHHWGLRSAVYQRFVGQTFVGKVCVNAKKLQGWESFRVLERPDESTVVDGNATGASPQRSANEASKTIYLILCSSRFGKGMWLAKQAHPTLTPTRNDADIVLSKRFAHALALTYATDLSAFEYLANDQFLRSARRQSHATQQQSQTATAAVVSPLSIARGSVLHAPVLLPATDQRTRLQLPWLDEPITNAKRFFQLPDKQLQEVVATTLTRSTVEDVLALFARDATTQEASSSATWQPHPSFGLVTTQRYRPDRIATPGTLAAAPLQRDARVAIALDAFVALSQSSMDRATFRFKLFPLGCCAFANSISLEVVVELVDLADTTTGGPSPVNLPVLQFVSHAGVVSARSTATTLAPAIAAQLEHAALASAKRACDSIVTVVRDARRHAGAATRSLTIQHVLAIELARALVGLIDRADVDSSNSSAFVLPLVLPWRPLLLPLAAPLEVLATATLSTTQTPAPTAHAFFVSAPPAFQLALEEPLGSSRVTPQLVFHSLISDESAFAYSAVRHSITSMNQNVSIGAWVAAPLERLGARRLESDTDDPSDAAGALMRLQTFRMLLESDRRTGASTIDVLDFQYHAFVHDEATGTHRLEFGSKIYCSNAADAATARFSIETLVHVEMHDGAPSSLLRVFYAVAPAGNDRDDESHMDELPAELRTRVDTSVCSALRAIWKHVALTLVDASQPTSSLSFFQSSQDLAPADIQQRLQTESKLPLHDELTSKVVAAAVAAMYS